MKRARLQVVHRLENECDRTCVGLTRLEATDGLKFSRALRPLGGPFGAIRPISSLTSEGHGGMPWGSMRDLQPLQWPFPASRSSENVSVAGKPFGYYCCEVNQAKHSLLDLQSSSAQRKLFWVALREDHFLGSFSTSAIVGGFSMLSSSHYKLCLCRSNGLGIVWALSNPAGLLDCW